MKRLKMLITIAAAMATLGSAALAGEVVNSSNSESSWKGSVFGDVGGQDGITSKNFEITESEEGEVRIRVSNNKGKIASSSDGLIYYYQEIDPSKDFSMTAVVEINDFASNNQVAFGLMVRDDILIDEHDSSYAADYVAAGAIRLADPVVKHTFTRIDGKSSRRGDYSYAPSAGDEIRVNIEKRGSTFTTWVEADEPAATELNFAGDTMYVGMYAVRNADITFRKIELEVE